MMRAPTARFLWRFTHAGQDLEHEREILTPGCEPRSATLYAPAGWPRRRPAWVLLHGITVPGRHHDALRRIARGLTAAGHYAIAPEIAAWRNLRVDPYEVAPAIDAASDALKAEIAQDMGRIGVVGFSVAGRWAVSQAASQPGRFRIVASMGGYWDIHRTLSAMVTGLHEWEGRRFRYDPDPYGRWIMGANLLPMLVDDQFGSAQSRRQAAESLHMLAMTAGQNGAMARAPVFDRLNASLRERLPPDVQAAWDALTPRSGEPARATALVEELVRQMATAGVSRYPLLQEPEGIGRLDTPVVMLHGRADRLVPFTETLRLAANLPPSAVRDLTISRLFGHTREREAQPLRNPVRRASEITAFAGTVTALLSAIEE